MKRKFALATTVLALMMGSVAAAHTADVRQDVEPRPGIVDASSALYGLDVAFDNAAVQLGLRNQGDIAFERASEVSVAVERNNSEAVNRSLRELNDVAEAAQGNSTGLVKAEQVLNQVRERVSEQARKGIDEALGNVNRAQERRPDNVGPENAGRP